MDRFMDFRAVAHGWPGAGRPLWHGQTAQRLLEKPSGDRNGGVCHPRAGHRRERSRCCPTSGRSPTPPRPAPQEAWTQTDGAGVARRRPRHGRAAQPPRPRREHLDEPGRDRRQRPRRRQQRHRRRRPRREHVQPQQQRQRRPRARHARRRHRRRAPEQRHRRLGHRARREDPAGQGPRREHGRQHRHARRSASATPSTAARRSSTSRSTPTRRPTPSRSAVRYAGERGAIVVASAGNNGRNIDLTPSYPASLADPAVLAVAAQAQDGVLWQLSNTGLLSVDLAAPGARISVHGDRLGVPVAQRHLRRRPVRRRLAGAAVRRPPRPADERAAPGGHRDDAAHEPAHARCSAAAASTSPPRCTASSARSGGRPPAPRPPRRPKLRLTATARGPRRLARDAALEGHERRARDALARVAQRPGRRERQGRQRGRLAPRQPPRPQRLARRRLRRRVDEASSPRSAAFTVTQAPLAALARNFAPGRPLRRP